MVAPVRWCWCSWPAVSARSSKAAPPGRRGEVCGAGGIRKDDGVAVVRAWQTEQRCRLVGVDLRCLLRGGPWCGGGRLGPSGSVDAYSLVDDLGRCWVHAYIFVVPFVALREIAIHILE